MILQGVNLSPYTRRIAIALMELDVPFDYDVLRVFETPEKVRVNNPMARVPTMVLDDGEVLVESAAILDEIDQMVGPDRALTPPSGASRRKVMQITAHAVSIMEKAQWAFYERRFHPEEKVHEPWEKHNDDQVIAGLKHLDFITKQAGAKQAGTEQTAGGWIAGTEALSQADISVAVACTFVKAVRKNLDVDTLAPALCAFSDRMEERESFKGTPLPI